MLDVYYYYHYYSYCYRKSAVLFLSLNVTLKVLFICSSVVQWYGRDLSTWVWLCLVTHLLCFTNCKTGMTLMAIPLIIINNVEFCRVGFPYFPLKNLGKKVCIYTQPNMVIANIQKSEDWTLKQLTEKVEASKMVFSGHTSPECSRGTTGAPQIP